MSETLHAQLLAAHETGTKTDLIRLYTQAADQANDVDTECFFLTIAYVFALECGSPQTAPLHARLKAEGREAEGRET